MRKMIVGVRYEGGEYVPSSDERLPIRFYDDGTIEDDFLRIGKREPVDALELQRIRIAADENMGRV